MKLASKNSGFTFIELMLVIAILGILLAFISGNFINSLKKGRDAKRKSDLEQIQTALEMYYEDKKVYPSTLLFNTSFADPLSGKVYMARVPTDPKGEYKYRYCTEATYQKYQLYAQLENLQDTKAIIEPEELSTCTSDCSTLGCNYGVSSGNTTASEASP